MTKLTFATLAQTAAVSATIVFITASGSGR
jgi:hypothetical protein